MESVVAGNVVILKTNDGEYQGTVKVMSDSRLSITLNDVITLPDELALEGPLIFFIGEIRYVRIVSNSVAPKKKQKPFAGSPTDDESKTTKTYDGIPKPAKYFICDQISEEFGKSIQMIMEEKVIGTSLEGFEIGRKGCLCWLNIATSKDVFLFDIRTLDKEAFKNGLKDVLENPNIIKVIHDCRMVSDSLYNQFGIGIVNVFDTQIGDVCAQKIMNGQLPPIVRSLTECLLDYGLITHQERQLTQGEKNLDWRQYPMPEKMLDLASRRVIHLRTFRLVLMEAMMSQFIKGVDIYLSIVRDTDDETAAMHQNMPHLLPQQVRNIFNPNGTTQSK